VKRILALVTLLCLSLPLGAAEPPQRIQAPPPEIFLEEDTISVAVLLGRAEDAGFRSMVHSAWQTLRAQDPDRLAPLLGLLLQLIGKGQELDALLTFLPMQVVRVDSLDEQGMPVPTMAITVSGWPGLQSLVYAGLTVDKQGQPLPRRDFHGTEIILRPGWENPRGARVLTRVKGTFLHCPTVDRARQLIQKLDASPARPPETPLAQALARMDRGSDTYGVVSNQGGALLNFLHWLNAPDYERVRTRVGPQRLDEVAAQVTMMSWEGDIVSEDQVDLSVRFETASPAAAEELTGLLLAARVPVEQAGRLGHLQVAQEGSEVQVLFSMVGLRDSLRSYLVARGSAVR
jgi:hypothetical protein